MNTQAILDHEQQILKQVDCPFYALNLSFLVEEYEIGSGELDHSYLCCGGAYCQNYPLMGDKPDEYEENGEDNYLSCRGIIGQCILMG